MRKMTTSRAGIDLIKKSEGLVLSAYKCPAGVWTIGYGHTNGVRQGMRITQEQASKYLAEDVAPIEALLNAQHINFRQEQFDALVSWIFNLGVNNFGESTMLKLIRGNAPDEEITGQMVRWVHAGGKALAGLKKRRVYEANMFLGRSVYFVDKDGEIKKV